MALQPQLICHNLWLGGSEASRYTEKDTVKIGADLSFVQELSRQVGFEGTNIPYPTVCRYRQIGTVDSFDRVSNENIEYFRKAGKEDPSYDMGYKVEKVELIASNSNSANCADFVKQKNDAAANGGLHYIWSFKDLTDNVLFDTWYVSVFTK